MYNFDFHGLSITVDQDLEEYERLLVPGLGLHLYEALDRSKAIRFRHEQAHFTSFVASGLADLYGVFSDYTLTVLHAIARREAQRDPNVALKVPVIADENSGLTTAEFAACTSAWKQIESLRAVLFGFGAAGTIEQLTASSIQDDFWEIYFDLEYNRIVQRFYRLLATLGAESPIGLISTGAPVVRLGAGLRKLTARSVMEAYAITIEILNTHFRKLTTNLTSYSTHTVRNPGPVYTVAIEYLLERIGSTSSIGDYMAGRASHEEYLLGTAISFAAMQVPVIQELDGEVRIEGSFGQLSSAHRFVTLVEAVARGKLHRLSPDVRRSSDDTTLLQWLRECHAQLNDNASLSMCLVAQSHFEANAEFRTRSPEDRDMIETAWAARANFLRSPAEYVLDAGLFAETYPCQVRHIRTRDGKLIVLGDPKKFQLRYIAERTPLILEAAVFAECWDSIWGKFPDVAVDQRLAAIETSIVYADMLFGTRSRERPGEKQVVVSRFAEHDIAART